MPRTSGTSPMIAAALNACEQMQHDEGEDQEDAERYRSRRPYLEVRAVVGRRCEARARLVDREVALVNRDNRVALLLGGIAGFECTSAFVERVLPRGQSAVALTVRRLAVRDGAVALAVGVLAGGESLVAF